MSSSPAPLFRSFFQGGFECGTQRLRSGRRVDVLDASGHDRFVLQDYRRLREVGIQTARDGFRWHLIERSPGEYDFHSVLGQLRAAREAGVQVIWDLMHYGWPDFLDPWAPRFPEQFARFARACGELLALEGDAVPFVCPTNEISFLAWGGGDVEYLNPFGEGRGDELKRQLVRATILAVDALREVCPAVRVVYAEPVIQVSAHPQRPQDRWTAQVGHESQFQAWEMLSGRLAPELGGHPRYLDLLGLNYYPHNHWLHHGSEEFPHTVLHFGHPEHRPLRELLRDVYARYGRPLLISETGREDEERPAWLRMVAGEVFAARRAGVPLEGLCLYPILNHAGWDDDRHCHNGLWDYPDPQGQREIYAPLAEELRRQQAAYAGELAVGAGGRG